MNENLKYVLFIAIPIIGFGSSNIVLAAAVTAVAYYGMRARVVYGMFAMLVGIEALYGFDFGVLSLSYLAAVMCVIGVRRFIALPAWHEESGWRMTDAVRAWIVACGMHIIAIVASVTVECVLYGYGMFGQRILIAMQSPYTAGLALPMLIGMIVLRRFDTPFYRPIIFGT